MTDARRKKTPRRPLPDLPKRDLATSGGLSTVETEWQLLTSVDFFYRRRI